MQPDTVLALRELVEELDHEVVLYKEFNAVPPQDQANVRNDMYVASEALRLMDKAHDPAFTPCEAAALNNYKSKVDKATKFIPTWVKVAVALALGLGTMVGWKRIVITVGEQIGKDHLTYAQGASAGLVAMGTIFAADKFGLPVSTTHILSSGVAGTMSANGSGLRLLHDSQHRRRLGLYASRRGVAFRAALLGFSGTCCELEAISGLAASRGFPNLPVVFPGLQFISSFIWLVYPLLSLDFRFPGAPGPNPSSIWSTPCPNWRPAVPSVPPPQRCSKKR